MIRSIRLTLVIYFGSLLAVGLGATAGLLYRTAAGSLETEQSSARAVLLAQHHEECQALSARFDEAILAQARAVAHLTQSQFQWHRLGYARLTMLGSVSAAVGPYAYVTTPSWVAEGVRGPLNFGIMRRLANELQLDEGLLPRDETLGRTYFQINSEWGQTWRSSSLGDHSLTADTSRLSADKVIDWAYDDVKLFDETECRRVVVRAPLTRFRFGRDQPMPDVVDPPRFTTGRGPPEAATPWIVVQFATAVEPREAEVNRRVAAMIIKFERLDEKAETVGRELLLVLCLIAFGTFAATLAGGVLLVGVGLSPLQRLTEAVSKVSPRNFDLELGGEQLPAELEPISARLSETLDQLRLAFEREKQAAADISHELRTPVAALLATAEVALKKPRGADDYRRSLVECRDIAAQMKAMVERLMALAKLDSGNDAVRAEAFDARSVFGDCAALVRPLAEAAGLRFEADLPRQTWTSDVRKWREVALNLLHNAVEYNRPGGSIRFTAARDGDRLVLTVADTGIGIAPDHVGRLFERFYRADPSRHVDDGLHTGLGLSIVKGYVDLLNGRVTVESRPGVGSTFRVEVPVPAVGEREAA